MRLFPKDAVFPFLKLTHCPENSLIFIIVGKILDGKAVIIPGSVFDYRVQMFNLYVI